MKFWILLLCLVACSFCQNEIEFPPYFEVNPVSEHHHDNLLTRFFDRSGLSKLVKLFVPVVIRDFYKFFRREGPRKVDYEFELRHGTIQDVVDNYINSQISNCKPEQYLAKTCVCDETFEELNAVESKSMYSQVAIAANTNLRKLVVSYRGTSNIQNSLDDFEYNLIDAPSLPYGAQVHRGFYSYHLAVFKPASLLLARLLDNPKYINYTVQLTGYSLGAAAAVVSLPDWISFLKEREDHHPIEIFSYSGPRPGNPDFADFVNRLNIPVTRYTNFNDIVPHLPPRAARYSHAGVEIYQGSDEVSEYGDFTLTVCGTEFDEDPNCSLQHQHLRSLVRHLNPFNAPETRPTFC